jgi:hypothetical protein
MVESTAQQFESTASNSNLYNEKPADEDSLVFCAECVYDEDSIVKIESSTFGSKPDTILSGADNKI